MTYFKEIPEQWVEDGDAEIAAQIFTEEPDLLSGYFMFKDNPVELEKILKHFEELVEDHRTITH